MRYSGLRYLIILLIALQSVMAVTDIRPTDQIGETNSDLSYQINLLDKTSASSAKNTTDQSPDSTGVDCCLDCGDCNCCSFFTFSTVNLNTSFNGAGQLIADYQLSIVETPFFPFLRPPKG